MMKQLTANELRNALDAIEVELLRENDDTQRAADGALAFMRVMFNLPNDMTVFYKIRRRLNQRLKLGKWYRQRQPRKRNIREKEG